MPVAIRAITRLQDADDINVSLGAGVDEYALVYDHDTARFVLRAMSAGVTDHGALTGLSDDDHSIYLLATGARTGASAAAQAFTNGIIGPSWKPAADSTTALQLQNAAGTSVLNVDTTNSRVGIMMASPGALLHIKGASGSSPNWAQLVIEPQAGGRSSAATFVALLAGGVTNRWYFGAGDSVGGYNNFRFVGMDINGAVTAEAFTITPTGDMALGGNQTPGTFVGASVVIKSGLVGIGTTSPATLLHVVSTTATTDALRNVLTLGANVTAAGVGAAGLGPAIVFQAESSTTADTTQARIAALWYEATDATFKADLVGYASDKAGEREIWRGRANGSAPAIGFLGAAPIARIAHVADPAGGATVDAEARSAINSILATLEGFGLHATS